MDVDEDGQTDVLLVAAPMFYQQGWEQGRVYLYSVTPQVQKMYIERQLASPHNKMNQKSSCFCTSLHSFPF